MDFDLLKKLSDVQSVPGREERVRELILRETKGLFDSTTVDPMGSLIAVKKARKAAKNVKKVLLACHIDEIGFYVKHVDDKGFLRLNAAGGFDTRNLFARRVTIHASTDGDLTGLLTPGGRPVHIAKDEDRKKIPEVGEFYVDCCLPADEVKRRVRVGDPVVLQQNCVELGDCVTGKAMDNRVAGFVAIEALRKAGDALAHDLTIAFTVQEEVGLRGAGPAAYASEPDVAIGIDVTLACDTPGVPDEERVTTFGGGVALTIMDASVISDRGLIDAFAALGDREKIPYQFSVLPRGGTDTGGMQRIRGGIKAMTYSVPCRNIHTVNECVHKNDVRAAVDLLAAWLST